MASSSKENAISQQHISELTVTNGARLFAGTNTTTNIYNGPVNLHHRATKARQSNEQTPSYYEVPNRRVAGFVGREDILQKISEALSDGSGPRYAVLQGMGGQGKSQVALEYCHRKKNNPYSAIFWVDATTQDRVERSFQSISERIKRQTYCLPDTNAMVAFVLKTFTSWTVQWLLVFDNYDDPEAFPNIKDFIPQSEHGAILVTSRHPDSNALVTTQSNHFIELSGLEESAAVALLTWQSQTNKVVFSDAKKIVERLGCHPLAITQAGAYIKKRKLQLCEFLDHYKRRKKIILESTPQLSQYRKRLGSVEEETSLNVFTTWELSFQQLQSEASEKNVETQLLTLLAFFNEKDISEQLFARFKAYQDQFVESARLLIWLNAFSSAEGQWDSDFFEDVLIRLRDSSLLQAFAQGLDGFYHASLHPLVKDWIRLRTEKLICQNNTYMAATLVTDILLDSWQDVPLLTKQNIPSHIIALEESYQDFFIPQPYLPVNQKIFDEFTTSQAWFARFLSSTGSHHLAVIINRRLNVQNERVLGLEHPDTLTSMGNLASALRDQGLWHEAEELEVQVMDKKRRVLGLEHPETLTSMVNLASTFWNQGRWKEAEKLELQVIETRKRVFGLGNPSTLAVMGNLASTFCKQGRWKEAEELELQVMETKKRVLGLEHPHTLTSMANLATTYQNQGRWKEAKELEVQVMETKKRVLGLEHPDTLISMNNLATTYEKQGQWKEAEKLSVQVMETSSRVLGLDHLSTLISTGNLASSFLNQGRWKEAEELDVQGMGTSLRVLGLEHPHTLKIMGNLASTYRIQGRWKEAEELEVQVMETIRRVLGLEHPDTLNSIANLALTFWNQGRWKKAEKLFVQVMETRKRVLGLEHPDTLNIMGKLASTYQKQGRWTEAEELEVQAMERSSRVLGPDHPQTLNSMAMLASTYQYQGRWKEANKLEVQVMERKLKLLGPEHPDTLASMNNLASTFWNDNRWKDAVELFMKVMETRKKVLGLDHPDTLTSMANGALAFSALGMKSEAIQLMSEVVQYREKKIGSDHPDTIQSLHLLHQWRGGN